jgi:hypothetical protein
MATQSISQSNSPSKSETVIERLQAYRSDSPQSAEQPRLSVVPFPAPEQITQLELAAYCSLCGRLSQLEKQVESAESSIKSRLESGCSVEEGDRTATLKENFRRNVAWKEVVVRLAERLKMDGEAYCARVLNSTKPSRTVSLVVE